ncbi:nucleotidyltransferase domain-containing protein [Candidatus Woesearchaeota archaeon]|nr:nucleotidyltransferase domain-containing protein [Candidatus Woesearchaeota archaeon]
MNFKKQLLKENEVKLVDYQHVINKIQFGFDRLGINVKAVLGGSVAKGTHLKNYDLDIFVRFFQKPNPDQLEKVLKKEFGNVERLHGSRDYFTIEFAGKRYEIVPVLKIDKAEQAENVTDVSMLHVEWVRKHLKRPDEAKLAKLFCRGQKVYGAESYINGFSGYLLEILVVYYGTFDKMIKAVAKWKPKVVIDAAKHYKNKDEIFMKLNASKLISPIIVIDPVQKNRNAAAAVNDETFNKFVEAAKRYVKKPSIDFFIRKPFSIAKLEGLAKNKNAVLVALKVEPLEGKEDVVYTKLLKAHEFIRKNIKANDFTIYYSAFEFEEHMFWYVVGPRRLAETKAVLGPKQDVKKEHIRNFKKKYKDAKLVKGRYVAKAKRKYLTVNKLIDDLLKDDEVRKRAKKVEKC